MRILSVKKNFFVVQSENAMKPEGTISGNDVYYCSEEERKVSWMSETRITISVQAELKACRDELDWVATCYLRAVNDCPEDCPPMYLPIGPNYAKKMVRRSEMAQKGILLPTFEDNSQNVLSTTNASDTRSSAASGNFIMLAIANAMH